MLDGDGNPNSSDTSALSIVAGNNKDGLGNDVLAGGRGADMFVFSANAKNGFDVVKDFQIGEDKIHIIDADSVFQIEKFKVGDHTRLEFNDTKILLRDVDITSLSDDDFVFTLAAPADSIL